MRKWRSLTALRACEAVARTGSVSAAAAELNVTRPAISKQLAAIEQDLGVALFERSGNRIVLTDAGRELCTGLRQAFDLISSVTESVSRGAQQGQRVRLLVCRDFATGWLGTQIGSFLVANPGVSVEITAEENGTFRLEEDFDFRIFYGVAGEHPKGSLTETELCRWIDIPVCTQAFADNYLQAGQTADVPHLIDARYDVWPEWFQYSGFDTGRFRLHRTLFNETNLSISVAAAGGGLAMGDSLQTLPLIRLGELIVPFRAGLVSAQSYSLFTPSGRSASRAALRFERWLHAAVADFQSSVREQLALRDIQVIERSLSLPA